MRDLQGASWITCGADAVSPVFDKHFTADKPVSATLFITGLGFFEAKINGVPVSEDRFVPAFSDYGPRDLTRFAYPLFDHTAHRIYYCRYDVSALLADGPNVLSVQLGGGYYRQTERICEGPVDFGRELKTIFRLVITGENGVSEIVSDGTETWKGSEICFSNLFIGEATDPRYARRQKTCPVQIAKTPQAELCLQTCPPDRVMRILTPVLLHQCGSRAVYDAGENISGVVRIRTSAPAGTRISLRYAENIRPDFTLDFTSTGSNYLCSSGRRQIMEDLFISDGKDRAYEPKFTWHAFRYFEVEGETDLPEVLVIHADTPVTSAFTSSSEGLNFLYDAFVRTQTNNMHAGVPSDCPHRERLGYTGDGQVCAPAAMLTLDCENFYRKWIQDILDCQDPETGHVQHTAPLMGGGGGPGGWGCAMVLVPWAFYRHYGDEALLRRCFGPMQKWIDYLLSRCEDGLVVREEEKGWCLGEWCTLESTRIPESFVNTCYLLKCLGIMQQIAVLLQDETLCTRYAALEQETAASLRRHFEKDGHWCDAIQGADAWALWAGLGNAETARFLAQRYDELGCFDTGFLGTDLLLEVLLENGYTDTAFALLESDKPGSFLYMKRNGATTLWERWTGEDSHDHPMFGACVRHLFTSFLGIRRDLDRQVVIAPQIPHGLSWAEGSLRLNEGEFKVRWEQQNDQILFSLSVPQPTRFVFGSTEKLLEAGEHSILCQK